MFVRLVHGVRSSPPSSVGSAHLARTWIAILCGMAWIVRKTLKSGNSVYLVRYRTVDGGARAKQFDRKRDADAFLHQVEAEKVRGELIDPRLGKITLADWVSRWFPTVTSVRPTTQSRNEICLRLYVLPRFGKVALASLDRTSMREWITELDAAGLAPATIHKTVQILAKALRAAQEDRLVTHNPAEHLPLPKIERQEMRSLTHAEVQTLAAAIDPRYRAFILLASYGGLRLGEMLALRWSRVDLDNRRVRVAETLTDLNGHFAFGPPKTRAAIRTITIPPFVCEALAEHSLGLRVADELVLRSPEGAPVRASLFRRRFWVPAINVAGLAPLRVHDLRHTAVSLWIAEGANPKQVAVRAGHTSVSVVLDRYGHLYPQHDDDLMAALQRAGAA